MIMNGSTTHIKVILEYEETDEVCFFIKKSVKKTSDFFNYIVQRFSYAFQTALCEYNAVNVIKVVEFLTARCRKMARNKKNLKMQMLEKLDSLNMIGAKKVKEGGGCIRARGVHSISTLRTYRSCLCSFAEWMKTHHGEVKQMSGVTTEIVKEYVEDCSKNYSNFSTSKTVSALNKVFHEEDRQFWNLSEFGDFKRRSQDIVRNRLILTTNHTNDMPRNASAILFCRAFGIRRQSVDKITTANLVYHPVTNEVAALKVCEKGGRSRLCYCLPEMRAEVNRYLSERIARLGEGCHLCDHADSRCNLHIYRAYHAEKSMAGLVQARQEGRDYFEGMRSQIINEEKLQHALKRYTTADGEYRTVKGYPSYELCLTSQLLGHNRGSILTTNYLGHGMDEI